LQILLVESVATTMPSSSEEESRAMIDGLKLTITGEELRSLLERQIESHERSADRWKREQERNPEEATDEEPMLPEHMCATEAERHEWRADVLEFMREHIDVREIYRLGEDDLTFGELLPEKPGWLEQQEYEERTAISFQLERLTKTVGQLSSAQFALATRSSGDE
jgi:hypothetical protein